MVLSSRVREEWGVTCGCDDRRKPGRRHAFVSCVVCFLPCAPACSLPNPATSDDDAHVSYGSIAGYGTCTCKSTGLAKAVRSASRRHRSLKIRRPPIKIDACIGALERPPPSTHPLPPNQTAVAVAGQVMRPPSTAASSAGRGGAARLLCLLLVALLLGGGTWY